MDNIQHLCNIHLLLLQNKDHGQLPGTPNLVKEFLFKKIHISMQRQIENFNYRTLRLESIESTESEIFPN